MSVKYYKNIFFSKIYVIFYRLCIENLLSESPFIKISRDYTVNYKVFRKILLICEKNKIHI